jgi:hypothetical protein
MPQLVWHWQEEGSMGGSYRKNNRKLLQQAYIKQEWNCCDVASKTLKGL